MDRKYTNRRYLDALNERVLIYDGAMGTSIQSMNLTVEQFGGQEYYGCNDYLVLSYPQAIESIHRSFLEVGVDVIETDTFRANRITLGDYGLADRVVEINQAAASLARRLADEYSHAPSSPTLPPKGEGSPLSSRSTPGGGRERARVRERFVAGSIGPSGKLPSAEDPALSNVTFDELADVFREQATGLLQGGVDVLLIETSQDILEVKAAVVGIQQAFEQTGIRLPVQVQVTLDTTGRMLLGTDATAVLAILEGLPIDVIGLNCSTGPEHMREPIRILGEQSTLPVACIPNAGLPLNVDGQAVYPLEPEPFAEALAEFVEKNGISVVGGCCGTTPAHLKLLVEKIHGHPHPPRPAAATPRLASATLAVSMIQNPPPLLIGERCNAQGSKKFKQLLLAEDYDAILEVARDQVTAGAHALDLSTAVTERPDELQLMRNVVKKLASGVEVPLVIDSTEPDVLNIALQTAPGRCLINSTHLEGGRAKADKVFALAEKYNAAVICLTIDESGMAKTADRKLEVARRIYDIAVNDHGLRPEALVFDALTFTLATGDPEYVSAAVETLEGIRRIKAELPGVLCSLGVSNLSFGLAPVSRPVLNSVMLYHAVQAGLDAAIVNPAQVTPYAEIPADERLLAEDLIFNRRPDALQRYIEHFDTAGTGGAQPRPDKTDPTAGMTTAERLHWRILRRHVGPIGKSPGVEADIDEIINRSLTPNPSPEGGGEHVPSPFGRGQGEGKFKANPPLPDEILLRVRELRQNATDAEKLLWYFLRNRTFHDAKFRRRHPVAGYILDFYCHEAKLAIELDSSQHLNKKQAKYDEERTRILGEKGIRVLRFWNSDVLNNTEAFLNEIWVTLDAALTPSPSPKEGGESPLHSGEGKVREMTRHEAAVNILNTVLLPAMKEVGDKFGAGELILPFVLQSAEVMKKAVSHLETYLEKKAGVTKGTIVLATVYGDVHDIGKNLVKTILSNNGYTVVDLGKQVPAETILTQAVEVDATAIGLSALLVSTSRQMPLIVNELQRRGLKFPVLIGGAAINRRFGRRILFTEDRTLYQPGVFYCKDAFEGLETMEALTDPEARPALLKRIHDEADLEMGRASVGAAQPARSQRSGIVPAPIPLPAKLGPRLVKEMPLELVFQHLAKNELFRLSWGAKNAHGQEWDKIKAEYEDRLMKMEKQALKEGWLKPQGVYGIFPCQSDGDDLIVYDPTSLTPSPLPGGEGLGVRELTRFSFPRQPYDEHLCLADYFAPVDSGQMDVVAFQVVTVGREASERFDKIQAADDYSAAYFLHGLAVQTAEATAEYLHRHVRRELGLPAGQGKRYSWGYPAIPELEDHCKVFELLPEVVNALGMSLTAAFQLVPEQSTAAIIVHHPQAKYYTLGESRVEQLTK